MNNKLKILLAAILLTSVFTREKICEHLGFGQAKHHGSAITSINHIEQIEQQELEPGNYFIDNSLYRWDEERTDWIPAEEVPENYARLVAYKDVEHMTTEPLEVTWKELINISYELRYFSELDMEIYAPVFPKAVQLLDGKEVVIKGFVIPIEEEQDLLSLSANPYAACFFCGKASPASVISLYLKNKRKRYKVDDFKKFRGTLHLNYDDPDEFYYILKDASEEKGS